jgi:hypothetical protein
MSMKRIIILVVLVEYTDLRASQPLTQALDQ